MILIAITAVGLAVTSLTELSGREQSLMALFAFVFPMLLWAHLTTWE
jgi:hypothetical protein